MNHDQKLNVHVLCLALNEEVFISKTLQAVYPHCRGVSVLTQYDRDWFGKSVAPDSTLRIVAGFPDPEGKVHLVMRRWRDQAAALNCEMDALSGRAYRGVEGHGSTVGEVRRFHERPDYFWIVDADEVYDPATIPSMLALLGRKRPRGMRVWGVNYLSSWNRRVPGSIVPFRQFGFVRAGLRFTHVREVTWNEHRLRKLLGIVRIPDFAEKAFGFMTCPPEVGMFHHGCWLGSDERLLAKARKSAHESSRRSSWLAEVDALQWEHVSTESLPRSIREAEWPEGWIER